MGAVELTRAGVKLVRVADLSDAAHNEPSEG
jgi:hypothetical protein